MRLLIIGNNDGPLRLMKSLNQKHLVKCITLQKKVSEHLHQEYIEQIGKDDFYIASTEDELRALAINFKVDLIINCFGNIYFKVLHRDFNMLNVHLSFLPYYRGRHPMHWALLNGENYAGVSIHKMTAKIDQGDILWQKKVTIDKSLSVEQLRELLMQQLEVNFSSFLQKYINQEVEAISHENTVGSYQRPITPQDSEITNFNDEDSVYRKIKTLRSGQFPAFITVENKKIEVLDIKLCNHETTYPEITLIIQKEDSGILYFPSNSNYLLKLKLPTKLKNNTYQL